MINSGIRAPQLQTLFDSISVLIAFVDQDLIYRSCNTSYAKWIGLERDQIINRSVADILGPELFESRRSLMAKALEGQVIEFERWVERSTGEKRFLKAQYQPFRVDDGTIRGFSFVGHDQTLQRRSEENERANLRNLFRQTPEMFVVLRGPEHVFEFVNEAHIKVLGFDATGLTVREAQPESVEVHGILDEVYRTGVTAELHEIPVTVGDRLRHFNLTYAARRDVEGTINGVMICGIEVTEQVADRRHLEKTEERYKLFFEHSPLPKFIFDPETYEFIDVNQTFCRIYGFTKEEVRKITACDIRPPAEVERFKSANSSFFDLSGPRQHGVFWHRKKDGTVFPVEVTSHDLILNGRRARLSQIVDVTSKLEYERRQTEIMETLTMAKEEAERASTLKSTFLANMSHEIRTPLGAMIGFADLLRDPGLSRSEHASYVDILIRNGEQLSHLINDILDLSKVEAGHLTLEITDVSCEQIAADVISLLSVKAKDKGIALDLEFDASAPRSLVSDGIRLRQVLMNLVGNAVKFTDIGSVRLKAYGCESKKGQRAIAFEIADTGVGIPSSQHDHVFEMFVQADESMTRKFGGTGLGLALSRRLARELGGDVTLVSSEKGKGTVFRAVFEDLPERRNVKSVSAAELMQPEVADDALAGVRVLVVDDSPDNQRIIWHFLRKQGALIETADNGFQGYRKALSGEHDMVLMDIQMPEMDGYTATQKLRDAGFRKPIIALTAHAMSEVRSKCMNVGCTDYLPKPINPKNLVQTVARWVPARSHELIN